MTIMKQIYNVFFVDIFLSFMCKKSGSRVTQQLVQNFWEEVRFDQLTFTMYSDRQAWANQDQTPPNATSDQSLHFLPLFL